MVYLPDAMDGSERMRAYVLTAPGAGGVQDVPVPPADPGEVVVAVERVGVCGTDVEFFTGEMSYLHDGHARYPLRLGHEWCGTVTSVGSGADARWLGRRGCRPPAAARRRAGARGGNGGRCRSRAWCRP